MSQESEETLLITEIKLLLSEKRTYLAVFRTGAALFGLSVTAFGALIVFIDLASVSTFDPSLLLVLALVVICLIGGWQMVHAHERIRQVDALIREIETKNKRIAELYLG